MIRRLLMAFLFTDVGRFDLGLRITPHFALASISVTSPAYVLSGKSLFLSTESFFNLMLCLDSESTLDFNSLYRFSVRLVVRW